MRNDVNLARTPLYELHLERGARMVPFTGYEMPVQYPGGIIKEHLHTRAQAGLFDVSHMGQVLLTGENVTEALERLVPVDLAALGVNQQTYAVFTNQEGGILDDLIITRFAEDQLFLVVNAACKAQDIQHLKDHMEPKIRVEEMADRALLALQGPAARAVMMNLAPAAAQITFMNGCETDIDGIPCYITCSGYTGEDGFEISLAANQAETIARLILRDERVQPVGLGARDSLRLEAGLCLYGHDMDEKTSPPEAALLWSISRSRRTGGDRAGGFIGAEVILDQIANGVSKKRVGLAIVGRVPAREGAVLENDAGEEVGVVTSGGFGPSLGAPVAMAMIDTGFNAVGTVLNARVRGKRVPVEVAEMPFVPQNYFRG
jgi:aminomethyltransferase